MPTPKPPAVFVEGTDQGLDSIESVNSFTGACLSEGLAIVPGLEEATFKIQLEGQIESSGSYDVGIEGYGSVVRVLLRMKELESGDLVTQVDVRGNGADPSSQEVALRKAYQKAGAQACGQLKEVLIAYDGNQDLKQDITELIR